MKGIFNKHKRFLSLLAVFVVLASMVSVFAFSSSAKEVIVDMPAFEYNIYEFRLTSLSSNTSSPTEFEFEFDFYVQGILCDLIECYRYGLQGGNNVYYVRARKAGTTSEYMWLCGATVGLEDNRVYYYENFLISVLPSTDIPSGFTTFFTDIKAQMSYNAYRWRPYHVFLEIDQNATLRVPARYVHDNALYYIPVLYAGNNYDSIVFVDNVAYLRNDLGDLFVGTVEIEGSYAYVSWNDPDIEFYLLPCFNPSLACLVYWNNSVYLMGDYEILPQEDQLTIYDVDISLPFADGSIVFCGDYSVQGIEFDAIADADEENVIGLDIYYTIDGVDLLVYSDGEWLDELYSTINIISGGIEYGLDSSLLGFNCISYNDQLFDDSLVTISVEYRYGYNNTQAAPTEFYTFSKGESYSVNVPTINGWLSNVTSVSGVAGENTTYTVFYYNGSNDNISPGDIQSAYDRGFNDGFNQGQNNASANPFTGFFTGIWSALVDSFDYVLNGIGFNGITLGNVIFTLVIIVVVGLIVKLLL